jgi:Glycosyl transferase family 2/Glycosyl transferases group 1
MAELAFVLAPGQNAFFGELATALSHELRGLGVASSVTTGGFPDPRPGRVYALVPPHEYAELRGGRLPGRLLGRTIFVCAEQPGTPWFGSNLALTRMGGAVFDVNAASVRRLRELGLEARHLPLGYTALWDRFDAERERPVDIAFLASATARRERLLARWAGSLWRRRAQLVISDNSQPNVATSGSFVAGEDKWSLLGRTKVLLNVHRTEEPYFEWQRVLEAILCGAVVVSERSTDFDPLVPGEHFLSGRPENLHLLADELLEDADRRRSMQLAAYELVRGRRRLAESAERLAEVAERLDRRPGRRSVRLSLGWRPPPGLEPTMGAVAAPLLERIDRPGNEVLRRVKEARLHILELSRRVGRLEWMVEGGEPAPDVRPVAQTSEWGAGGARRVSVVTAVHNHAGHVRGALDSVVRGRYRDFELVVVDDGSTDHSAQVVRDWMLDHDSVPALLLSHPVNRGLPASRNTAIAFARGELVLILDSDNALYPHALERLTEALDSDPGAAFAYGILEKFDDSGPVGLLGFLGWDPDRLREQPYIDALALVRTSVLREVGGFTTDIRLYGWEDYDLWCTLADRGMRGAHVKEIVARYRHSTDSMLSLTNLSLEGARAALAQRHPRFVRPPVASSA